MVQNLEKKLFVGALERSVDDNELRSYFSTFGEVEDCIVIKDDNQLSKGFGFVTFMEKSGTDNAMDAKSKGGHCINGKYADVKRAVPRESETATKLFLGGLLRSTTAEGIKQYFADEYNCRSVQVEIVLEKQEMLRDPSQVPKPRGFAFATIDDPKMVEEICGKKFHKIDGKDVEVKKAAPKRDLPQRGGGRFTNQGGNQGGNYNQGGNSGYNQGGNYNQPPPGNYGPPQYPPQYQAPGGYGPPQQNPYPQYNAPGGAPQYSAPPSGGAPGYPAPGGYPTQPGYGQPAGTYPQGGYPPQQGGYGAPQQYGQGQQQGGYNQQPAAAQGGQQAGYGQGAAQPSYGQGYQNRDASGPEKSQGGGGRSYSRPY